MKVNESKREDLYGQDPQSSLLSDDGSFVVLERSPPEEPVSEFVPYMSQQSTVFPSVMLHNNYTGGLPRLESQVRFFENRYLNCTPTFAATV